MNDIAINRVEFSDIITKVVSYINQVYSNTGCLDVIIGKRLCSSIWVDALGTCTSIDIEPIDIRICEIEDGSFLFSVRGRNNTDGIEHYIRNRADYSSEYTIAWRTLNKLYALLEDKFNMNISELSNGLLDYYGN